VDLIVHRPAMGPLTAVARAERLSHDADPASAVAGERYTAGSRIRLFDRLSAELAVIHQTQALSEHTFAADFGVTYSFRRDPVR
jgi:hypothetical protein